jgi:hypothetical protein
VVGTCTAVARATDSVAAHADGATIADNTITADARMDLKFQGGTVKP